MCAAIRTIRAQNAAAVRPDDRLADREADANSCILGAEEAVEDAPEVSGGDARPIVEDGKADRAVFVDRRLDVDPTYRLTGVHDGLDAVDEQVDDHLLQLNPVTEHLGKPRCKRRR